MLLELHLPEKKKFQPGTRDFIVGMTTVDEKRKIGTDVTPTDKKLSKLEQGPDVKKPEVSSVLVSYI